MENLHYFKIGMTSINTYEELNKLKEGKNCNTHLIEMGYEIIKNCERVLKPNVKESFEDWNYYKKLILNDLDKLRERGKDGEKILLERIARVEGIKQTLETIIQKEEVSKEKIEESINFFKELDDNCLAQYPQHYF
jgi:hypothetical protein